MSERRASTLRIVALALAGLVIAAAVGVLAGNLTSRQIGITSEPLEAGSALAPAPIRHKPKDKTRRPDDEKKPGSGDDTPSTTTITPTTTVPETTAPPTGTGDDSPPAPPPSDSSGSEEQGEDDD